MSNSEQAALTVIGAVAGAYFGYPALGYALGSLAGQALFPTQLSPVQGPRLGDSAQTISQVGAPIPWIFGEQAVGGTIIWASPIREVASTETVGGKGGPEQEQTTYKYYRSFAVLLCEGPIAGVRKIFQNGKIVYDRSGRRDDESLALYQSRILTSDAFETKFTLYLGDEDQMPDPTIEMFEGVGNVPAYRGYAYGVFNDVELKAEDGFRVPAQFKFIVFEAGAMTCEDASEFSNSYLLPWLNLANPINPSNLHEVTIRTSGRPPANGGLSNTTYVGRGNAPLEDALSEIESVRGGESVREYGSYTVAIGAQRASFDGPTATGQDTLQVVMLFNNLIAQQEQHVTGLLSVCAMVAGLGSATARAEYPVSGTLSEFAIYQAATTLEFPNPPFNNAGSCGGFPPFPYWHGSFDAEIFVVRIPGAPPDVCDLGTPLPDLPGYCVDINGRITSDEPWVPYTGSLLALSSYANNNGTYGAVVTSYPLNPVIEHADERNTQAFWEAAYAEAVSQGLMPAGLIYDDDYPVNITSAYYREFQLCSVNTNSVSIADIVRRICARVGLSVDEIDVSDLEDREVVGYQISRSMTARDAIEPLRKVAYFDAVESVNQLMFPTRGKPPVATLKSSDLGVFFVGEEKPSALITTRTNEIELPRQFRIHFQNPARDYDPDEQLVTPERGSDTAVGVADVEIAVAITTDQAIQAAEVMAREMWAARTTYVTQVDVSQGALEPADSILVPVDDRLERMRLISITDRHFLRSFELVRDDDGAYISTAVGGESQHPNQQLFTPSTVALVFLDLPPLEASHNDAGFYIAATPIEPELPYRGVRIARSNDGSAFTDVAANTTRAIMGEVITPLPIGPTTVFDEQNELLVSLQSGELESRDEIDVINEANAAAIGADGRWEIIQFKNAENTSGSTWRLTGLTRGRRGTEHAVGTSQAGDRFVLLQGLTRLSLSLSTVGQEIQWKALPIGSSADAEAQTFTPHGEALKPFSPVHISAALDEAENLTISWIRRDRFGIELATEGGAFPMSEASEAYEVEILGTDGAALRVISTNSTQIIYTAAQQVTDFGAVVEQLELNVYQISAAIGRSHPGRAVIVLQEP